MYCHFLFASLKHHCAPLPREETLPTSFSSDVGVKERWKEAAQGEVMEKWYKVKVQNKEQRKRSGEGKEGGTKG